MDLLRLCWSQSSPLWFCAPPRHACRDGDHHCQAHGQGQALGVPERESHRTHAAATVAGSAWLDKRVVLWSSVTNHITSAFLEIRAEAFFSQKRDHVAQELGRFVLLTQFFTQRTS